MINIDKVITVLVSLIINVLAFVLAGLVAVSVYVIVTGIRWLQ
jgi:hypothetical protein